ncbi:MAG: BatD family protein [Pseudomonadota bacterium]|nr:BatD family protein [Pseudomonadota bacterium]
MVRTSRTLIFLVLTLLSIQAFALNMDAKLNTAKVTQGDTVKLTVTIDESADGQEPDFSILNEHFEILSTYKAERSNITNGRFQSFTSWVLTLLPKQTGYIAVPPISYGNTTTKPLKLHVTKRSPASNADQYLFVDAKIDKQQVYVQEQLIYTVRIFRSNVDIYDPSYQPPTIDNVAMEQLGEQRNYKTTLNGMEYDVFEFRYALFPQKSGSIKIPSAQLNATVFRSRSRGFTFDPFNGKQVRRYSPELEFNVKPKPDAYPADKPWLPAKSLALSEHWSPDTGTANIGEPITRTVTMQAEGVLSTILPALPVNEIKGVKIYPEQADTASAVGDQGIVSTRTESQALIATQPGAINLPEITITWWDVDAEKVQVTSLPARAIQVTGSANRPQTDSTLTVPEPGQTSDAPPLSLGQANSVNQTWQWIAVALLCLWLITLGALVWILLAKKRTRSLSADHSHSPQFSPALLKQAHKNLTSACHNQDARSARSALIELFRQRYQDAGIRNLEAVQAHAESDSLVAAIRELDAHLYRQGTKAAWSSGKLMESVEAVLKKPRETHTNPVLAPLYPQ